MNLTPVQNKVIHHLQNGWTLITSSEMKGAIVCHTTINNQYHIHNGVFWNLVDKGLIYQQFSWPFNYVLTKKGEEIKTKPVKDL